MSRPEYEDRVPAGPFAAAINREVGRLGDQDVAYRLRVDVRTVFRYKTSLDAEGRPTDNYARKQVEDVLERLDLSFADLYPEIAATDDIPLEPEAFCGSCHEVVTPLHGACPWCDGAVTDELPKSLYCKREKRLSYAAGDGLCWRCGGHLTPHIPHAECGCGCGTMVPQLNATNGREVRYARGHNPRMTSDQMVPTGPLVEWIEHELANLDKIEALSFMLGVQRQTITDLLRGEVGEVQRIFAARMLKYAAFDGRPAGHIHVRRRTVPSLKDLYGNVNSRVCPDCDGKKSPNAQRCLPCRRKRKVDQPTWLTDELLAEAFRLRLRDALTFMELGERLLSRTRYASSESLANSLRLTFRERGWPTDDPRRLREVAA